jgi:flagellar motility protein MotE (MotC chaperone)
MIMQRYIRDLRLIPIALIASACLLVLKIADIALDSSRLFGSGDASMASDGTAIIRTSPDAPQSPGQKLSWAQQMFNFPTGSGSDAGPVEDIAPPPVRQSEIDAANASAANADITGAITQPAPGQSAPAQPAPAGAAKSGPAAAGPNGAAVPPTQPDGIVIPINGALLPSGAEQKILERLQQRREQLDARERELDIRENLVKAAEQRIDAHLAEVKAVEARIKTETQEKDKTEAARFKDLVTMYENMKARDAAKIFDGLDMDVLIQVTSEINPRVMSDIMAQMTPDIAQRLTVALASKAQSTAKNDPAELPKIQGQPTAP